MDNYWQPSVLAIRLALHLVTAVAIVSFMSKRRSKLWPTLIAVIGGGGSAAAFIQGLGEFDRLAPHTQPWVMCVTFAFAAASVYSRGNMARIFSLSYWRY